jgi:hypothetical protein
LTDVRRMMEVMWEKVASDEGIRQERIHGGSP